MIKVFSLITVLTFSTNLLWAGNNTAASIGISSLTLIIAGAALVLAIINALMINKMKKVAEVDLINQKDDMNVSMEAVKVVLYREIRNLRRELGKSNKPNRPNEPQKQNEPQVEKSQVRDETAPETTPVEKKPYRKRPSNFKRRPPRKKEGDTNSES